jgi:hypothetical protein
MDELLEPERGGTYPDIWAGRGYPEMPSVPALVGDVTHAALELILEAIVQRGCPSPASACAVDALKELGGYTSVISSLLDDRLAALGDNPRAAERAGPIEAALRTRVPEMRQRVQAVLSRSEFGAAADAPASAATAEHVDGHDEGAGARRPLKPGSHPEVTLRAAALRWMGRADLVTLGGESVEIVDFKTGAPHPSHADQLRIYALLWYRDADLNPSGKPASRLSIAYPTDDVTVEAPAPDELAELESELQLRSSATCPVRHMCEEYWDFLAQQRSASSELPDKGPAWGNVEMRVDARNGARSWWALVTRSAELSETERLMLRTHTESPSFAPGDLVRVVNGAIDRDDDSGTPIVTLASNSELFTLSRSASR